MLGLHKFDIKIKAAKKVLGIQDWLKASSVAHRIPLGPLAIKNSKKIQELSKVVE